MHYEYFQVCKIGDFKKIYDFMNYFYSNSIFGTINYGIEICVYNGHYDIIKTLFDTRDYMHFVGDINISKLIIIALMNNHYEIVKWFCHNKSIDFSKEFFKCCEQGNLNLIKKIYEWSLIESGERSNRLNSQTICDGFRRSCIKNYIDIAKFLYEKEKDIIVNSLNEDTYERLFPSADCDVLKIYKWLYSIEINPEIRDRFLGKCLEFNKDFDTIDKLESRLYKYEFDCLQWIYSIHIHKRMDLYDKCEFYRKFIEKHKENYVLEVLSKLKFHYIYEDVLFDKNIFERELYDYLFHPMIHL